MGQFVKVAKVSNLKPGTAAAYGVGNKTIAVFNVGGTLYAIDDECPHAGAPLSEGFVEGEEVECPWHAARFSLKTGACLCEPADENVASYAVRVTGDDLEVEV